MKKKLQYYLILGVVLILVVGFAPLSPTDKIPTLNTEFEHFVQTQRTADYQPAENTLRPLSDMSETSYLSESELAELDLSSFESNTYVEFDMKTRTKTTLNKVDTLEGIDIDPTLFQPKEGIIPTYSGHIGDILAKAAAEIDSSIDSISELIRPSTVFPPDDRVTVPDTTVFPFSSMVKIYVDTPDGPSYIGSGAVIDDTHVLTVAHVAYIHEDGGLVTSMEMVPGKSISSEPYGSAFAEHIRMPVEWLQAPDSQYDWALITMDQPLGALTGWLGVATYPYNDPVYTSTLYTAGFPGDIAFGEVMINTTDVGSVADELNHWYWLDTFGGQSGSPVWTKNATGEYIITVNAYEYSGGGANFGTRINNEIYTQLAAWLSQDADPVEKPEFRALYWDTTAAAWARVYKKKTEFGILTDIENIGRLTADELTVGFYLSSDNDITTEDYLIGTETVTGLEVLESEDVDWYGTVPKNVPDGQYYMGYVIDPFNAIEEYDENDNTGSIGTQRIIVDSTAFQAFIWSPLGMGVLYGGIATIVLVPSIIITVAVIKRRKLKKLGSS